MKKVIQLLGFVLISLGLYSCSDSFLGTSPTDELSDATFWNTEEDARAALVGAYHGWEDYMDIIFLDAASDNGYEQFTYGYRQKVNGTLTPSNMDNNDNWYTHRQRDWWSYRNIRTYNNFLAKIEDVSMDSELKEQYKAEVRFLRAYDYFKLTMWFGDVPLVTDLIGPLENQSRTPEAEVKQFILRELEEIRSALPVKNQVEALGMVTRGAALALKSRLELYMGNYSEAMNSAQTVIDMGVYELFPDYRELFLAENQSQNREAILSIQFVQNEYKHWLPQFNLPAADGGWSALGASRSMIEVYETDNGMTISEDPSYNPDKPFENRDPRLKDTIIYPGQEWNGRIYNSLDREIPDGSGGMKPNPDYHENAAASRPGQSVKKYIEPVSSDLMQNWDGDIMVFRLAEMYLTFAEAAVESGQNTNQALQYINELRTRAGHVETSNLTRELVRRERRVELAFEGLRYYDIKRWDLGAEVLDGPLYGSRLGSVDIQTGDVTWEDNYIILEERNFHPQRNYLLPIPQGEFDTNPEMTQNPGY